jgi:regulator of extracellular matrix RemA (YlzA/DUF370 family)
MRVVDGRLVDARHGRHRRRVLVRNSTVFVIIVNPEALRNIL